MAGDRASCSEPSSSTGAPVSPLPWGHLPFLSSGLPGRPSGIRLLCWCARSAPSAHTLPTALTTHLRLSASSAVRVRRYNAPMLDLLTHGDFARHRRLRRTEGLRRLVAETRLSASDFIYPLLVTHGQGIREEIPTMPGQFRISLDQIGREADDLQTLGIPAVLLFGLPAIKDDEGSEAYADGGIIQDAVRTFKE